MDKYKEFYRLVRSANIIQQQAAQTQQRMQQLAKEIEDDEARLLQAQAEGDLNEPTVLP